MRGNSGSRRLPVMVLLCGIAALVMRRLLYAVAVDAKGLLVRNHPLTIALVLLTAVVLLFVALAVRKFRGCGGEQDAASIPAALGNAAASAGILVTVLTAAPMMNGHLGSIWRILGLAAPVCLLLAGVVRGLGRRPFFLLHVVVCLFFMLHIVTRYQLWSGNPQMQDYVFSLLGVMGLMFFGFYTAAQEAGCGSFSMKLGMGLAAVYLCLAELGRSSAPALYLGGILWVLTELFSMQRTEEK